jgi:hypothetical protein
MGWAGLSRYYNLTYWVIRLTLSTTNDVCSDESSVMANDSVTVWPLYAIS